MTKHSLMVTIVSLIALLFLGCSDIRKDYGLASINNSISLEGTFFLASGVIKDEPVFYFYIIDNGVFYFKQIPARRAAIIEQDIKQPKAILVYGSHTVSEYGFWTFYVPKGSVYRTFKLDVGELK